MRRGSCEDHYVEIGEAQSLGMRREGWRRRKYLIGLVASSLRKAESSDDWHDKPSRHQLTGWVVPGRRGRQGRQGDQGGVEFSDAGWRGSAACKLQASDPPKPAVESMPRTGGAADGTKAWVGLLSACCRQLSATHHTLMMFVLHRAEPNKNDAKFDQPKTSHSCYSIT